MKTKTKLKYIAPIVIGLLAAVLMVRSSLAETNLVVNGDFESGNLAGWTTFTTDNGSVGGDGYPAVVQFDTDGDGTTSFSAKLRVGQEKYNGSSFEGGGVFQSVPLQDGVYTLSAKVALHNDLPTGNGSGGRFELLLDGVIVDTQQFDSIAANTILRSTLSATADYQAAATHEVRIRVTRPYTSSPAHYVDDVVVSRFVVSQTGTEENSPPTADANGPYKVKIGGEVVLDGSGSDPDGHHLMFDWDLDDDGVFETHGQFPTFSADGYNKPGSVRVVLQVCDPFSCDTDKARVNVQRK